MGKGEARQESVEGKGQGERLFVWRWGRPDHVSMIITSIY